MIAMTAMSDAFFLKGAEVTNGPLQLFFPLQVFAAANHATHPRQKPSIIVKPRPRSATVNRGTSSHFSRGLLSTWHGMNVDVFEVTLDFIRRMRRVSLMIFAIRFSLSSAAAIQSDGGGPGTPRRGALAVMRNDRISIRPHYRLSGRLSDKPQQTRREATVKHKTDVRRPGGPARFRCGSDPACGYHALEDTDLKKKKSQGGKLEDLCGSIRSISSEILSL